MKWIYFYGAKVSKPRKGGRTPLEKDTTDQTERQPLLETSSIQGALDLLDHIDEHNPFELIYLFQTKASLCYGCRTKRPDYKTLLGAVAIIRQSDSPTVR